MKKRLTIIGIIACIAMLSGCIIAPSTKSITIASVPETKTVTDDDPTATEFTADITTLGTVSSVSFIMLDEVQHLRASHLTITLTAPSGEIVTIIDGDGGSGEMNKDYYFINKSSALAKDFISSNLPGLSTDRFKISDGATNFLSKFEGATLNGQWILRATDLVAGTLGNLDGFVIKVDYTE